MTSAALITLYSLALLSVLIGAGAIYLALIQAVPLRILYVHYLTQKPAVWLLFFASLVWVAWITLQAGAFPPAATGPLLLLVLGIVLAYRMHQEVAFQAVDFPIMSEAPLELPLLDDMELAVIEYQGETGAYPLDFVIHHHVVNDRFSDRVVSLTYCAMCRSVIPFDVTDLGPLFVASFKNGNMVVADRRTKTFFQQATFDSVVGPLHPQSLEMLPFQILPWKEVKRLDPLPRICQVTERDFREFQLPIPGIWKKIVAGDATPGLRPGERDKTFPARTRVVGVIDPIAPKQVVYLKSELQQRGLVENTSLDVVFVAHGSGVNAYRSRLGDAELRLSLQAGGELVDQVTKTTWDALGRHQQGPLRAGLEKVALSDEYWFSWKLFHPTSELIRIPPEN